MRYIVIIAIALLSALITGGVSPQLPIFGAEPDILLVAMLAMQLREKTLTPVIVCSVSAIFIDAFYAHAIGYYSLPYAVVGVIVFAIFRKRRMFIYAPSLICAAAWLVKDVLSAVIAFFLGNSFDFSYIFVHSTLPGMLVNAVLIFPAYLLMLLLYKNNFMVPRSVGLSEEFPGLVKKRR